MNILYITSKPIYPKIDGGCVAMANFLDQLVHSECIVKHLTIATDKHPFYVEKYPQNIINATTPEGYYIDTKVRPFKAFMAYFNKSGSFNVNRFYNKEFESKIIDTLKSSSFDVVILDSLYTSIYLDSIRSDFNGKVIIRSHNVESDIWFGLSSNVSGFKKIYFKNLAKNLKDYEISTLNKSDGILTLSSNDEARFMELGVESPIKNIPISIDSRSCERRTSNPVKFVHLGAMNWKPNVEAVQELMNVFPKIKENLPDAELHIAGSKIPENLKSGPEKGIFIDGFIPDIQKYLCSMNILVSPIRSGSGIRVKLLEAMAFGIPCITTSLGALGIDYKENKCLIIANNREELVAKAIELGSSSELQNEIGSNAINYIRSHHNTEKISSELLEFIQKK